MRSFIGSKYEETKDLDIKEIAKLVRKDLKQAYPNLKFNVRIERYSMGQSLHIHVLNPKISSEEAKTLIAEVRVIADAYNYDNSDPMTDYYDVNFYVSVSIDGYL